MKPVEARELLGPHAVIGVDADTAADIIALRGLDIDYAVLDFDDRHSIPSIREIINEVRKEGVEIHIVARGRFALSDFSELKQAGVNGFAVSRQISDTPDPVAATAEILDAISR